MNDNKNGTNQGVLDWGVTIAILSLLLATFVQVVHVYERLAVNEAKLDSIDHRVNRIEDNI